MVNPAAMTRAAAANPVSPGTPLVDPERILTLALTVLLKPCDPPPTEAMTSAPIADPLKPCGPLTEPEAMTTDPLAVPE